MNFAAPPYLKAAGKGKGRNENIAKINFATFYRMPEDLSNSYKIRPNFKQK